MNNFRYILLVNIFLSLPVLASPFDYGYTKEGFKYVKHNHSESSYQHAWCSEHNGIEEFENSDFTRVDCLTNSHAVEFDFANKWAESIGQALHYQKMTGKQAKIVLILEKPTEQMLYYKRVKSLGRIYDFDVEYVTPQNIKEQNGKCIYLDCKCNKKQTLLTKLLKFLQ